MDSHSLEVFTRKAEYCGGGRYDADITARELAEPHARYTSAGEFYTIRFEFPAVGTVVEAESTRHPRIAAAVKCHCIRSAYIFLHVAAATTYAYACHMRSSS